MTRRTPPSFDFYPDDFIAGTIGMHPTARGIYISLLCYQWSNGSIPDPQKQLESKRFYIQITGASENELDEHLSQVLLKFEPTETGCLVNQRLQSEFDKKTAISAARREAGKRGGRPKAIDKAIAKQMKSKSGSRKTEVGRRSSSKKDETDWEIPDLLDCTEVRGLLDEFAAMRRRLGKPVKSRKNTSRVLRHFDNREHLVYALETCIANEYQGLKADYRPPASANSGSARPSPELKGF